MQHVLNTKYTDEVHLFVGIVNTKFPCGRIIGQRERNFDYSGKFALSRKDYFSRRQIEIDRVKSLPVGSKWIEDRRDPGKSYAGYYVAFLKAVGLAKSRIFHHHSITTIKKSFYTKDASKAYLRDIFPGIGSNVNQLA